MMEYVTYIINHSEQIAQVIGLVGLLGIIYKYGKKLFRKIRTIVGTIESLEKIAHELSPNGGSSLKDAVGRIEKRQIRMEQRERAILSESPLPIFESGPDGHCILINRSYRNLVGRSQEELLGQGWENILHPEDQVRVMEEWIRAVKSQRDFESEYRIHNKEKDIVIPVFCRATIMRSTSGDCLGWLGTLRASEKTAVPT